MSKPKKLYKTTDDKMLLGVCGGLGEYINVDPTVIRLIWIVFTVFSFGLGIIAYALSALIMPDKR